MVHISPILFKILEICKQYKSVSSMRFPRKSCINGETFITVLRLVTKLFKFEIQKCGQILCAHKPHFLMPGHIFCEYTIMSMLLSLIL